MSDYGLALFEQHAAMLAESTIPPDHAHARGYVSVDTKTRLEGIGVTKAGRNVPGLLIPLLRKDGSTWGYQYRPDHPRTNGTGKPVKYETPTRQRNGIDVPPDVGPLLDDPAVPLWVTEGSKKADAAACAGLACVALPGVWSWLGKNSSGVTTAIPDWYDVGLDGRRVILAFDSDVMVKPAVRKALTGYLAGKGAKVEFLHLPHTDDGKTGVDDYLAAGHTVEDLRALVRPDLPELRQQEKQSPAASPVQSTPRPQPVSLDQVHDVFRRWLGEDYDLQVLDVVLAVAAAEQLSGDPPWLLVVSGSGAAKTETIVPLIGAGALVESTIASEGALLSGTATRERSKDATGGLLRRIGGRGTLVIKDVTSVLSMNRDTRAMVLAALREVYDGRWTRNVGTDGGRTITWTGRIVVIGAVTTAWDSAHAVVAMMGDRFLLVRLDSKAGRARSGRQAIANAGDEKQMRAELAAAVGGLLITVDTSADFTLTEMEIDTLLGLADIVTLARTAVERDYRGDVIDAHAPEMPTRFAKQLTMVVRGALALGIPRGDALALAVRCARDSMPPVRLAVLLHVRAEPSSTTHGIRKRLDRPRTTVDQTLQALHALGLVTVDEIDEPYGPGKTRTVWRYRLSDDLDTDALALMGGTGNVSTGNKEQREEGADKEERATRSTPLLTKHVPPPDLADVLPLHAPTCPDCGFRVDQLGHENNCGGVA